MNRNRLEPNTNPYRTGREDARNGRPCKSPFRGFTGMGKTAKYICGYMDEEDAIRKRKLNDVLGGRDAK